MKKEELQALNQAAQRFLQELDKEYEITAIDLLKTRVKVTFKRHGHDEIDTITIEDTPYLKVLSQLLPFFKYGLRWFESEFRDNAFYKRAESTNGFIKRDKRKRSLAGEIVLNAFTLRSIELDKKMYWRTS